MPPNQLTIYSRNLGKCWKASKVKLKQVLETFNNIKKGTKCLKTTSKIQSWLINATLQASFAFEVWRSIGNSMLYRIQFYYTSRGREEKKLSWRTTTFSRFDAKSINHQKVLETTLKLLTFVFSILFCKFEMHLCTKLFFSREFNEFSLLFIWTCEKDTHSCYIFFSFLLKHLFRDARRQMEGIGTIKFRFREF